jgi:DtxR family Mn-dependent transcriptional regulator
MSSADIIEAAGRKVAMSHDLIDTTQMYLRTILELEEEGEVPLRARISERLDHAGPTVSQTVARMERDGLLLVRGDRQLELTDRGRILAVEVMRKHRLAERLLADIIKLDWELVHDEACRWEHVMSDAVEKKIIELIERPDLSPYGNPIPGLASLGMQNNAEFLVGVVSIAALKAENLAAPFTLTRIGEAFQAEIDQLKLLRDCDLKPGTKIQISIEGNAFKIENVLTGSAALVPGSMAAHLYVNQ